MTPVSLYVPFAATETEVYDRYLRTTFAHRNNMSDEGQARTARQYIKEFGPYLPTDRSTAILEIGCGLGAFLSACRTLGYGSVTDLDISAEQVAFCHQQGFVDVLCDNGLAYLRQTDKQYGLIVMSDVLEHLSKQDVLDTLQAIWMRLQPGGRVLLRVPNLSNPFNMRTRYVDFTHETGFTVESLQQVLRISRFEIETVHGVFALHRRWPVRFVFDQLLWRAFLLFYRHTMHLRHEVVRGKNLLAIGVKPLEP